MSDIKVKINTSAVRSEILQADFMLDYVTSVANSQAGADEHVKPFIGFDRAKAIIYPDREESNDRS